MKTRMVALAFGSSALEKPHLWLALVIALLACDGTSAPNAGAGRSGTMLYYYINALYGVNMATNKERRVYDLSSINESYVGAGLGPKGEIALAFNSSPIGPTSRLVILKPDGTLEGSYKHKYMIESNPQFSADGSKIAYTASIYLNGSDKKYSVQVASRTGTDLSFFETADSPKWLPDGRLVFQSSDGPGLFLSDTPENKDSTFIPNTDRATKPDVSPDGSRIVFMWGATANSPKNLYMIKPDGSGRRQVTTTSDGVVHEGIFSPNGKELLVSSVGCVSGSGPIVVGPDVSDVAHIIPADASKLEIPLGKNGAMKGEDGTTRCVDSVESWR
jgi:Tol biopolymer transport system component